MLVMNSGSSTAAAASSTALAQLAGTLTLTAASKPRSIAA